MTYKNGELTRYSSILEDFLRDSGEFHEAHDIARRNSRGRIWLIGGFLYRNVIKAIYEGIKGPELIDIDFLMENTTKEKDVYVPSGWNLKVSEHYGNNYLMREDGKVRIDLNFLPSFHPIISRKLRPRLIHFFTTTPLDIQSIAYDLTDKKIGITGERGIKAIKRRVVRINNLEEAKFVAREIMGITIEDLVKRKAEELGFKYDTTPMISSDYKTAITKLSRLL